MQYAAGLLEMRQNPVGDIRNRMPQPCGAADSGHRIIRNNGHNRRVISCVRAFTHHISPDFNPIGRGVQIAFHKDQITVRKHGFELLVPVIASFLTFRRKEHRRHLRRQNPDSGSAGFAMLMRIFARSIQLVPMMRVLDRGHFHPPRVEFPDEVTDQSRLTRILASDDMNAPRGFRRV